MPNRFDQRNKETFKKDIYFGTKLENYFFKKWLVKIKENHSHYIDIVSWKNNGCDNSGKFIEKGPTGGADFRITGVLKTSDQATALIEDEPLEVKWVPTAGKLTLKQNDLKSYVREKASILFIYNTKKCNVDLKKPKDYDLAKHIKKIEKKESDIRWGIMWYSQVKRLLETSEFKPIPYMGFKPGVVLPQEAFKDWFSEHRW